MLGLEIPYSGLSSRTGALDLTNYQLINSSYVPMVKLSFLNIKVVFAFVIKITKFFVFLYFDIREKSKC